MNKKMNKKIFLGVVVFMMAFASAASLKINVTKAASIFDVVSGWLWGGSDNGSGLNSGIGWVSLNSSDAGAGGAFPYAVTVPGPECGGACNVTGYGYVSNIDQYIDFAPQDHCTTGVPAAGQYQAAVCTTPAGAYSGIGVNGNGGVKRVIVASPQSDNLVGWARLVGIAKATMFGGTGGEDGWIAIGIGNGFDVTINPTTGDMSGMGWAGSTLGAMSFAGKVLVKPTVTLSSVPSTPVTFDVKKLVLPKTVLFSSISTMATSCNLKNNAGTVLTTGSPDITNYSLNINLGMNDSYYVDCVGPGGTASSNSIPVATVCYPQKCENQKCGDNTAGQHLGASLAAECVPDDTCTNDSDCLDKKAGKWIEVTK
jgi:hypothetical protein